MPAVSDEQARSLYTLLVLTSWADGRVDASEILVEHAILDDVPELAALPGKRALAAAAKRDLDGLGLDAAVAKAAEPLQGKEDRELAFVSCVRMLEADGIIAHSEFRVLRILRKVFGLSGADVARLLA
jgi:hypothetical protein